MSSDPIRRVNIAAIACEPRPRLPVGFQRSSTRPGAAPGAARTGLSVYELPPGQAVTPNDQTGVASVAVFTRSGERCLHVTYRAGQARGRIDVSTATNC